MDGALAGLLGGVIGAAVGGLSTTAAAYVTGRKAEAQTRLQIETQLTQHREQHRTEYLRERREPRAQAYTNFLASVDEITDILESAFTDGQDDPQHVRDRHQEAEQKLQDLQHVISRVHLEGPDLILIPAHKVVTAIKLVLSALEERPEDVAPFSGLREKIPAAVSHFVWLAREALEDEGEGLHRSGWHYDPWPDRPTPDWPLPADR